MASENGNDGDRLGALNDRIRAARESGPQGRDKKRAEKRERSRADGVAWRISAELVAAFMVCGFVGYWLDEWLGTRPWIMVAGLLLGGVVGMRNVYVVANRMSKAAEEKTDDEPERDR
ncbi:AtpZ/AtpI family protein [Minwuia sp.]|uniref:AtpZ/AtpI family protein n=1 Tax=Minwuia sp. TaxID=2493630 RepID=UPI003A907EB9